MSLAVLIKKLSVTVYLNALTLLTSGGRSVGIVPLWTKAMEFLCLFYLNELIARFYILYITRELRSSEREGK
jgi:hypothetical protein